MARKGIIKCLPPSFRRKLDRLILEGKLTTDQLQGFIAQCEVVETVPCRSAVGDYAKQVRDEASATALFLKESREMASAIAQELGPESVEGEQGRLLIEMLRTFLFRYIRKQREDPNAIFDAAEFAKMTRSIRDMSQAMQMEADFARRIRDDARKQALNEMKDKLDKATATGGLDVATAQEARRVLGLSDE